MKSEYIFRISVIKKMLRLQTKSFDHSIETVKIFLTEFYKQNYQNNLCIKVDKNKSIT